MGHILLLSLGIVHTACPEAGNADQYIKAVVLKICAITRVVGVVIDGISNCTVAVYLLKGYFPFIVALNAGEGDHWVKCSIKSLLTGVILCTVKLVIAVFEKFFIHLRFRDREIHRQNKRFGVPIGGTAVFFSSKALWSKVQRQTVLNLLLISSTCWWSCRTWGKTNPMRNWNRSCLGHPISSRNSV